MVTTGIFIKVETKPETAERFADRLKTVVDIVRAEGLARAWFGVRLGPTSFFIYDVFDDEASRDAHLEMNGPALRAAGAELFDGGPDIQTVEVVASLLPT